MQTYSTICAPSRSSFTIWCTSVPGQGKILLPEHDHSIRQAMTMVCWSEQESVGNDGRWQAKKLLPDASRWEVLLDGERVGEVNWSLMGEHNMHNGLMAIAAARHVSVRPEDVAQALDSFINASRRLELRGEVNGIKVYDDFAHHPTAILATLTALRNKVGGCTRILTVLDAALQHHEDGRQKKRPGAIAGARG
nr:Fructose-1,6-bisphosphatase class 1 [Candidatus Pantoea persica]